MYEQAKKMTEFRTTIEMFKIFGKKNIGFNPIARGKKPEMQFAGVATNSRILTYI